MTATGGDVENVVGGAVFAALALVLAAFTGWQLLTTPLGGFVGLLLGIVPGLLLALLLGLVGVWLFRRGPPASYTRRLVGWALTTGLFGALSATLFVIYEQSLGATIYDAPLAIANTTAGFAVVGLLIGRYDIRARQRAAELSRYKELVNNIPVGIFRTTPDEDGGFVEVNPAMVAMFEADDQEHLLQQRVRDLYADPDERTEFAREIREQGLITERETQYQRLDGETFWAAETAIRYKVDGQVFFDGIVEDITDRKRYEEALERHNDQLSVLNDVLRHDVRNDMAVIRARGELLRNAVDDGEFPSDQVTNIETLLDTVDHVVALTETARDLAEAVSADRSAAVGAVSLTETLRQELDAARTAHQDASITVATDIPNVNVRGDKMLTSVFRNLLTNAVQHNDSETPAVTVSVETTEDEARVRIADDGPGIPDDQKEMVFDHGAKGDDSGGTGLGLYLVSVLVDQYGGSVDVADNDPRGTVVSVTLPLAADQPSHDWLS